MAGKQHDEHQFIVAAVEMADRPVTEGIAITLTDARGGRVRLHLSSGMAERLREKVSAALDKAEGS